MAKKKHIYKKRRKGLFIAAVVIVILLSMCVVLFIGSGYYYHYFTFAPEKVKDHVENSNEPLTREDFLSVSENKIVNRRGETVTLEGVNLGGWLLQEYWMCPVQGSEEIPQWTNLETLNVLEERFGAEKAQYLIKTYEDHWITQWDIQNIAGLGCNVIRVPFWYGNFMSSPEGKWLNEDPEKNPGFQRLDWVIHMAEKYGLYVILDMHGCPGGQSKDHCAGFARQSELFANTNYQDAMEKLWTAIAARYKDSPAVAAYDIMNEPQVDSEYKQVTEDPRNILYDRMIKAIREVDPEHMIMVEGIWTLSVLPDPEIMEWRNVVYEVHPYGITDTDTECQKYMQYSQKYQVPVYIGEFSDMEMMERCRKYGIHYTSWTYKGNQYMEETWFMYYADRMLSANVCTDPYWLIKLKWGNCLSTQYFVENEKILDFYL